VNAKGGDAVATPVLWAAKRCHYYVADLLLQNGADPLLTDDQGFNLLHSATLDGNVFQLVLLLHQDIPIDIPDAQSHTALMWAAYKGFPACVDLFLRWGADVRAVDDQGFTALHWALVKGSQGSIQKLIEYGADRFAKNNDGKTPAVTAVEMNTVKQWHKALSEAGYNNDGTPMEFPIPGIKDTRTFISRVIFFWPFLIILISLWLISHYVIYFAVPAALVVAYGLQFLAQKLLRWAPPNMKNMHHTVSSLYSSLIMFLTRCSLFLRGSLPGHCSGLVFVGLLLFCHVCGPTTPMFIWNLIFSRDFPNQLFPQLAFRSILRPHDLFLLFHYDVRSRLRSESCQPKFLESNHSGTCGVETV